MTATNHGGEQQENLYNFFDPDLWLARIDGMVWLLRMTYDLMDSTLVRLDGLTVEKCNQLIQEIEGKKKATDAIDLDFSLLEAFLKELLQKATLAGSASDPGWAVDFDFEVKQLINLRSLCITYVYFFSDMRQLIAEALTTPQTAQPHPPLSLIQACYQHLANDFEILQRAFLQRQPSVDIDGKQVAGVLAKELVITDKLASKALAPFAHLLAHPDILTFFSQETHIRHLPFSDQIILVGLSHGRISITYNESNRSDKHEHGRKPLPAFELLAIPHEIGHYIYHHAKLDGTDAEHNAIKATLFVDLSQQFRDSSYLHWCEEIFADLFGCVVAGPLLVFSMQALLAASDQASLWQDDGEHPTAVVRPYILSEMLRVLASKECELALKSNAQNPARYQFPNVASSLDANWSAILQQLGFTLVDDVQGRPAQIQRPAQVNERLAEALDVAQIIGAVKPIIDAFAERLIVNAKFDRWDAGESATLSAAIPWVRDDQERLKECANTLAALTGEALAQQKAPQHSLIPLNFWNETWKSTLQGAIADEKLQHWLDNWGDSGPYGSGRH